MFLIIRSQFEEGCAARRDARGTGDEMRRGEQQRDVLCAAAEARREKRGERRGERRARGETRPRKRRSRRTRRETISCGSRRRETCAAAAARRTQRERAACKKREARKARETRAVRTREQRTLCLLYRRHRRHLGSEERAEREVSD